MAFRSAGSSFSLLLSVGCFFLVAHLNAAESVDANLRALQEQNRQLQAQILAQQRTIEALGAKMDTVLGASERHDRELQRLQDKDAPSTERVSAADGNRNRTVRISGEAGLAFFRTGSAGQFPNSEFRVDEAKLFFEAPVRRDTYIFVGLDIALRETNEEFFHLGELYVDFENVSALWGQERVANLRVGRFNIPFGTEYLRRNVFDNPLISHSLADIWGIDEGIELYGAIHGLSYVLAVQNGGRKLLRDFNSDKAVVGRLGYSPRPWLEASVSAMRTGEIMVVGDSLTEVWFGNGFFRALGNSATTQKFASRLLEAEMKASWKKGHTIATIGSVRFDDDDRNFDNRRRLSYFTLEGVQSLTDDLYAAVRFSRIDAPKGYPLVGWGDFGNYFFRSPLTEYLHRTSIGLGYRLGEPLVVKVEYTFEDGRLITGARRNNEDLLSTEVAMKF